MKATEFLSESQNTEFETLTEGPLGSLVKAAGRGIGKAVGSVAKGAGAVAGGVAGIGSAFKKGYQSGKTTVSGDEEPPAQPAATAAPSAKEPQAQTTEPAATTADPAPSKPQATTASPDPKATPKPTATKQPTTDTKPMAGSGSETEPAADVAKDTEYAKALKFVKGLPVAQQKEMVAMLQKDSKVVAAMNRPVAKKDTAAPAADTGKEEPAAGLSPDKFGQMAKDLAGGAQKTADAKPEPAPKKAKKAVASTEPDLTDPNVPISQAIKRRQAQGLAAGYENPNVMIKEGFSLFRKQQ